MMRLTRLRYIKRVEEATADHKLVRQCSYGIWDCGIGNGGVRARGVCVLMAHRRKGAEGNGRG